MLETYLLVCSGVSGEWRVCCCDPSVDEEIVVVHWAVARHSCFRQEKIYQFVCLRTPRELPEPFKLYDCHSTPGCFRNKFIHGIRKIVSRRDNIHNLRPIAVCVKVFGTHSTNNIFDAGEVDQLDTRGISEGADNPCHTPNVLVDPGRGLFGRRWVKASAMVQGQTASSIDSLATFDG